MTATNGSRLTGSLIVAVWGELFLPMMIASFTTTSSSSPFQVKRPGSIFSMPHFLLITPMRTSPTFPSQVPPRQYRDNLVLTRHGSSEGEVERNFSCGTSTERPDRSARQVIWSLAMLDRRRFRVNVMRISRGVMTRTSRFWGCGS